MQTLKLPLWLSFLLLLAVTIPPHVIGIDKFATIDEPWWVISGSNYYYALTHHDFANTIYDYHPAVTTTWVVTAGMLTVFPAYRGFGQGYFDVRKFNFDDFLKEHGKSTLDLLRNSRLIQSALLIVLALLSFFLLQLLIDRLVALLSIALAFDAPFFLGHSRLLNHEGMLALFALVSVLAMLVYLRTGRKWIYLLLSGAAFGLAQLTKSPSIVVIPVVGLMLFIGLFERGKSLGAKLLDAAKVFAIWLVSAAVVYVLLWPGMWVAPGRMLYEIYGNAFSYAFQGARLDVTQELQPAKFSLGTGVTGTLNFLGRWALRSTPVTWLGLLLAAWWVVRRTRSNGKGSSREEGHVSGLQPTERCDALVMSYLVLLAMLFILMFGVAQGRDSAHYILTSYVALDVVAGIGWGLALASLAASRPELGQMRVVVPVFAVLFALQLASALPYYPYYYTYENPLIQAVSGKPIVYGYGEGLEQAAAYLAAKPDAGAMKVYAYDGLGPFSYFFPGTTDVFKKVYLTEPGLPSVIQGMQHADYLVVYSAVQDALPESAAFLNAMQSVAPEKTIYIGGLDYARIYRIADIPASVYAQMAK